jgi:hypothetical protein
MSKMDCGSEMSCGFLAMNRKTIEFVEHTLTLTDWDASNFQATNDTKNLHNYNYELYLWVNWARMYCKLS